MRFTRPNLRVFSLLPALILLAVSLPAHSADPITGTVTNKTSGKVSAGDQVTLIQLQQGMQESTKTTTDARGRFTLQVPDEGIHLVRVTHEKAAYFQPVQPGTTQIAVTVYDAAPAVEGVHTSVEELHVEASATELHVVEVLQVLNDSAPQRTQFGPKGYDFYLPPGALVGRTGAITQGGMPVQTPAVPLPEPGHFTFLFPLRPGETQFGIAYTLPYTGKFTFTPKLTNPVRTFAVLTPTSMKLTPGSNSRLATQAAKPGTQTFIAQDIATDQVPEFSVSGTGNLPEPPAGADAGAGGGAGPNAATANAGSNTDANAPAVSNSDLAGGRGLNAPLDQAGDRDPWAKYKWWILASLALLLAGAAGILLRKPTGGGSPTLATKPAVNTWPPPTASVSTTASAASMTTAVGTHDHVFSALKEELFLLETERLQKRIAEPEYREVRSAIELILSRVLNRNSTKEHPATVAEIRKVEDAMAHAAAEGQEAIAEPAFTGRDGQ